MICIETNTCIWIKLITWLGDKYISDLPHLLLGAKTDINAILAEEIEERRAELKE